MSPRHVFIISETGIDDTKPLTGDKATKKRQRRRLPWWCVYIAWTLSIIITLLATIFTFFYGLQFKNEKTTSWLHSIVISFFCGVILTQPIKVLMTNENLQFGKKFVPGDFWATRPNFGKSTWADRTKGDMSIPHFLLLQCVLIFHSTHRVIIRIMNGTSTYVTRTPCHKACPNLVEWPKNVHS